MTETIQEKEVCITREEYKDLMVLLTEVKKHQENQDETLKEIKDDGKETRNFITGNGTPEEGILYRLRVSETTLATHILSHKERGDKWWDIFRPTVSKLLERVIEIVIMALALLGPLYLVLDSLLKKVSEIVVGGG